MNDQEDKKERERERVRERKSFIGFHFSRLINSSPRKLHNKNESLQ